jgi:hypothetical protein
MKKGIAMAELLKMNEASSTTNTGKDSSPVTIETLDGIFFEIQKYFDINDARVSVYNNNLHIYISYFEIF